MECNFKKPDYTLIYVALLFILMNQCSQSNRDNDIKKKLNSIEVLIKEKVPVKNDTTNKK